MINYRDAQGDASAIPFAEALSHYWAGVMATVSTCPYQQPLSAARWAIEYNVENLGFYREDAFLGVVVISPEDDCSANPGDAGGALYSGDADLGPLGPFFLFG